MWAPDLHLGHPQPADDQAGAAAGVYNTTRQVGAVLGSAGIAVLMQARLAADAARGGAGRPEAARRGCRPPCTRAFSAAMAQSLLLPAGRGAAVFGRPARGAVLRASRAAPGGAAEPSGTVEPAGAADHAP